jgi:hypothetical protein
MKRLILSYDKYRCRMLSFIFVMLIPVAVLLAGATAYMKTVHGDAKPPTKFLRQLPVAKTVGQP